MYIVNCQSKGQTAQEFDSDIQSAVAIAKDKFKVNLELIRNKIDRQDVNFYIDFIINTLFETNKYFNDQAPWNKKDDIVRLNTIVYTSLEIIRKISYMLYPIIPQSSLKALDIFGQLSGKFRNLKFLKVDLEKLEGEIGISFPGCNRQSKEAFFHLYPEGEDAKKVEASGANQLEQLVYMHFSSVKIIEKSSSLEFKDALEDHWMVCQCGTNASDELKFNYAKLAGEFDNVLFIQAPHADHGPDKFSIYKRNTVIHDGSIGSLKELEETLLSEGGRKIIVKISKYNDMIKKYSGHLWYLYIKMCLLYCRQKYLLSLCSP